MQRKFLSTVLLMVIGGWLLMFCQNCLAAMGDVSELESPVNGTSFSCHTPGTSQPTPGADPDNDSTHCLGVCECEDIDASFNNVKYDTGQKENFKNTIITDSWISVSVRKNIDLKSTYQIATLPERAILIPLQHFTVLLN